MRSSEAVRHIQHVAAMGLAPHVAIPVMMSALHHVVPSHPNPFFWSMPDGQVTDFHIDDVRLGTMESSMMLGRHNTADDVPTIDRLIGGPRSIDNTALLRQLSGWSRSAFFNDMLRGNNAENSVDFQLRDATGVRGMFALTRGAKDRRILAADVRRVGALVPHFLHAMNAPTGIEAGGSVPGPAIGQVIAGPDGEIAAYSAAAGGMLVQLRNIPLGFGVPLGGFLKRLPPAAMIAIERLRLIEAGRESRPASLEVPTRWGLFRVSATQMLAAPDTASGMIVVTIQPLISKRVAHAERLAATDLTLAERRVALRMAEGGDGDAIARDLGLQTSSYRQYAKRIYGTLGVDGRMGVTRFLDGGNA